MSILVRVRNGIDETLSKLNDMLITFFQITLDSIWYEKNCKYDLWKWENFGLKRGKFWNAAATNHWTISISENSQKLTERGGGDKNFRISTEFPNFRRISAKFRQIPQNHDSYTPLTWRNSVVDWSSKCKLFIPGHCTKLDKI